VEGVAGARCTADCVVLARDMVWEALEAIQLPLFVVDLVEIWMRWLGRWNYDLQILFLYG